MTKKKKEITLNLDEWKELMIMLTASEEDASVAISNITNLNLDPMYHVLFVKSLTFADRSKYIIKFKPNLQPIYEKIITALPDYNWYSYQTDSMVDIHGTFTWENILKYTMDISKREPDRNLYSSLVDIITYEMEKISPVIKVIKKTIKNYKI